MTQDVLDGMYQYHLDVEGYYLELNPSFVYEYQDLGQMLAFPFVMLRDGYFGLFIFSTKLKASNQTETIFSVPKKFEKLVPQGGKQCLVLFFLSIKILNRRLLRT